MSSVVFDKQNIESLVSYHIALLKRFDTTEDDEFSVVYFHLGNKKDEELASVFQKILRKTDALFQENDDVVVMLPGTDWNGATELLSGIQEFLGQPLMDNVVTYPDDGNNAKDLLNKLGELVQDNCDIIVKSLNIK